MQYYRSNITGLIVSDNFAKALEYIHGDGALNRYIQSGMLVPIDPPTVVDCIKHGSGSVAVVRYRELNPGNSWQKASEEVYKLKAMIKKERKKHVETEE